MEEFKTYLPPSPSGGAQYSGRTSIDPGEAERDVVKPPVWRLIACKVIDWVVPLVLLYHAGSVVALVVNIAFFWNLVWLQGKTGASLGKRAVGLRLAYVPDQRGRTWDFIYPGVGRCAMRYVLHLLDIAAFGWLRSFMHPWGQTYADSICKTVVMWDHSFPLTTMEQYYATKRGWARR